MKKYILLIVAPIILLCGCDDWLDKTPEAQLSPETFFSNESELQAFSNTFYGSIAADQIFQEQSDLIAKQNLSVEIAGTRTVPASGNGWSFTYIRRFNTLIEYADNCQDQSVREKYVALARFFRANSYGNLVIRFGDVPWYERQLESNDPDLYKPRDDRGYVMDKVIEDLDYAISHLDTKHELYRVTKWTALLVKSRFCLFEGTFRKYHGLDNAAKYLNLAADAAKDFIMTSGYKIHVSDGIDRSYEYLFASTDAHGDEIVLARDYNKALSVQHNATGYLTTTSYGCPGMTRRLAASYLMKDGRRFTDREGWETMEFAEECKDRDPRLAQSIMTPGYKRIGAIKTQSPNMKYCVTGYAPIKYLMDVTLGGESQNTSFNDLPIFRAAEAYLNYAEAKAELGTITQADIDLSIKPLRDRVGMPNMDLADANSNPDPYLASEDTGYPNVSGPNKGVILEIRRERSIELFDENMRYNDLMRWKEGKALTKDIEGIYIPGVGEYDLDGDGTIDICIYTGSKPQTKATVSYELNKGIYLSKGDSGNIILFKDQPRTWNEERDYLYPIPLDEITLTNGAIVQNPGW